MQTAEQKQMLQILSDLDGLISSGHAALYPQVAVLVYLEQARDMVQLALDETPEE